MRILPDDGDDTCEDRDDSGDDDAPDAADVEVATTLVPRVCAPRLLPKLVSGCTRDDDASSAMNRSAIARRS